MKYLTLAVLIFFSGTQKSHGAAAMAQFMELGVMFHSGNSSASIAGANSYSLGLGTQRADNLFRFHANVLLQFSSGTANVNSASPSYSMYGGVLLPGFAFYPMGNTKAKIQPFFGGTGLLGTHFLKLSSPPTGVDANTLGFTYGFEASAGVDLNIGSKKKLRIKTSYQFAKSSVAGQSGFDLGGFRLALGYVFN